MLSGMRQITILSGKGGTGKTTLTASFAALAKRLVVADCDVDAPDLHMLLKPTVMRKQEFRGSKVAVMDRSKCIKCGICEERCRFNAINELEIDPILCEGCGVCAYVCPAEAITLNEKVCGYAYVSTIRYGFMSHARLNPGEENSGKLVTLVRHNARQIAQKEKVELILNDGPPGIGCPVIASVTGVDLGVVVVEPTLSGIHDMERALKMLNHFQINPLVCINKYDLNMENTKKIEEFCMDNGIEVAGRISFDPIVTEAMVMGKTVLEYSPNSAVSREIREGWSRILNALGSVDHV
ncbi:MAG: MinD superfamily P-loop ATPase [Candidatus Bathyarchaeota archaeon B63]|nr:MAG: MinD superfamily P-loop ATPase [Candidatus Bathyarchaeota archaeon B63]